ncbi:winged helix-turn-helix transcriptional regulator [Winogradskyella luteola]|uniref:Helix-turn-helix transcriptional regulator n=1 Tax=Winogradskyella luteola TaxID=2828330 RepID=A0A9X1FCV0_9FLAO|nr:helix-turn-helix domain-containing protein [Winogradskyella luteola]MBV7270530.1 helix-turn-helix transcriptional regulator [Winogradskyella luteola]
MPDFLNDKKRYYTPVEYVFDKVGGLYKMPILWRLKDKSLRFSELKRSINRASDRMLSKTLKELVADGFVSKEIIPEVPVKTIYTITEKGKRSIAIISTLREYGFELMKEDGIEH